MHNLIWNSSRLAAYMEQTGPTKSTSGLLEGFDYLRRAQMSLGISPVGKERKKNKAKGRSSRIRKEKRKGKKKEIENSLRVCESETEEEEEADLECT